MNGFIKRMKLLLKSILFQFFSKIGIWQYFINGSKGPKILMYHRLTDSDIIPGISTSLFELQLQYLCKYYNVVSVDEIVSDIQKNIFISNKVALTFDDGYVDFYAKAWPLLKKYNVPASLYITTDFVDQKMWMWPDKVRVMLDKTEHTNIKCSALGELELTELNFEKNWHAISDHCLTLSEFEREKFLLELSNAFEVPFPDIPSSDFSAVSWEELRLMINDGLDIGSHTVTHPILTRISQDELKIELLKSKQVIESELDIKIRGICYPNGMSNDVSVVVSRTSKDAEYSYGLIAYTKENNYSDIYQIDRISASENMPSFVFSLR
jgi:peptidoglycan/xylan/chitin deacetylase (PgdA/CDA1 family)